MTKWTKLDGTDRDAAIAALGAAGWATVDGRDAIEKTYRFENFRAAMAWMVQAAFEAEALNHHPEWSNVYNRVSVLLTTHDADGLTTLDQTLAERLDRLSV